MKKITVERSYAVLSRIVPSSLLSSLKKTRFYRLLKEKGHAYLPSEYLPSWNEINSGPLKGISLFLDPKGSWQREMLAGTYDDFFFTELDQINLSGKVIYDIGAHIGFSSLYFAVRAGESGKVFTFEPNPYNVERIKMILEKNSDLGKRIKVLPYAVSDKDGETDFISSKNIENGSSSGSFIQDSHTFFEKSSYEKEGGFERIKTQTVAIDSLLEKNDFESPFLIKLDIEGAEYLALEGMKKLIESHKPLFLIEIHSIFNMLKVSEIFNKAHYTIKLIKEESDGRCFISATHSL